MDFLYFPDNKLEYIPAILSLLLFFLAALLTMRFIKKMSDRELQKTKHLEENIKLEEKNRQLQE
jgi:hypothetical protein